MHVKQRGGDGEPALQQGESIGVGHGAHGGLPYRFEAVRAEVGELGKIYVVGGGRILYGLGKRVCGGAYPRKELLLHGEHGGIEHALFGGIVDARAEDGAVCGVDIAHEQRSAVIGGRVCAQFAHPRPELFKFCAVRARTFHLLHLAVIQAALTLFVKFHILLLKLSAAIL